MNMLTRRIPLLTALLLGGVATVSNAQGTPNPSSGQHAQNLPGKETAAGKTRSLAENVSFYVVDGTPVTPEQLHALTPSQIQAIRIVKDRVSLAPYGPRAAKGAVFITTKQ